MRQKNDDYDRNVFINCPFDKKYEPLFHAIIFTTFDCGYVPRSAQESSDSSEVRIQKIVKLIESCKYGIHDISRIQLSVGKALPRFNMPLELGLFLGAKFYGNNYHKKKSCLILDSDPYRYQVFLSDIAGQDIRSHEDLPEKIILNVRDWLSSHNKEISYPGGKAIAAKYKLFRKELPRTCKNIKLSHDDLTFTDYSRIIAEWLKHNTPLLKSSFS